MNVFCRGTFGRINEWLLFENALFRSQFFYYLNICSCKGTNVIKPNSVYNSCTFFTPFSILISCNNENASMINNLQSWKTKNTISILQSFECLSKDVTSLFKYTRLSEVPLLIIILFPFLIWCRGRMVWSYANPWNIKITLSITLLE